MKTSVKIMQLTNQIISKSWNSHMNIKLTIRGFQRDHNFLISPCILRVIAPTSQRPNSDWKWLVIGQNVELKGQMLVKFYESDIHGKLMKQRVQWN